MENRKIDQGDSENKVGIVPHSQIEASDADSTYQDEASARAAKSDSDTDNAEDNGTPRQD